jgi:hypothetical protein
MSQPTRGTQLSFLVHSVSRIVANGRLKLRHVHTQNFHLNLRLPGLRNPTSAPRDQMRGKGRRSPVRRAADLQVPPGVCAKLTLKPRRHRSALTQLRPKASSIEARPSILLLRLTRLRSRPITSNPNPSTPHPRLIKQASNKIVYKLPHLSDHPTTTTKCLVETPARPRSSSRARKRTSSSSSIRKGT